MHRKIQRLHFNNLLCSNPKWCDEACLLLTIMLLCSCHLPNPVQMLCLHSKMLCCHSRFQHCCRYSLTCALYNEIGQMFMHLAITYSGSFCRCYARNQLIKKACTSWLYSHLLQLFQVMSKQPCSVFIFD